MCSLIEPGVHESSAQVSYMIVSLPAVAVFFAQLSADKATELGKAGYTTSALVVTPGSYGSPIHGKVDVTFGWKRSARDPTAHFQQVRAPRCTQVDSLASLVPADLVRGWSAMLNDDAGKVIGQPVTETDIQAAVDKMQDLLPIERVGPVSSTVATLHQPTASPVARLRMLQWWMRDRGAAEAMINLRACPVYLDGSIAIGKQPVMARRTATNDIVMEMLTPVHILSILCCDIERYNLAAGPIQASFAVVGKAVPLLIAFSAVMATSASLN